jgi:hypothetical protein
VLEALLRATPVLSAEDFLEQVRDVHADPLANGGLHHHQPATPQPGRPPVIETRPGVGYRITSQTPYEEG